MKTLLVGKNNELYRLDVEGYDPLECKNLEELQQGLSFLFSKKDSYNILVHTDCRKEVRAVIRALGKSFRTIEENTYRILQSVM